VDGHRNLAARKTLRAAAHCHNRERGVVHANRRAIIRDAEVEKLLSGLQTKTFASRDEQEVAGYADAMEMIFEG
jgi:hypothetical protein